MHLRVPEEVEEWRSLPVGILEHDAVVTREIIYVVKGNPTAISVNKDSINGNPNSNFASRLDSIAFRLSNGGVVSPELKFHLKYDTFRKNEREAIENVFCRPEASQLECLVGVHELVKSYIPTRLVHYLMFPGILETVIKNHSILYFGNLQYVAAGSRRA